VNYQRRNNRVPKSGDTIGNWIKTDYEQAKSRVRELVAAAISSVHLTIDAWTTPHQTMALLGIVAHFVGADGKLYGIVIGLEELDGPHSGMNMAEYVLKVVQDYEIEKSIGYLVMDNASSNETLAYELERHLLMTHWTSERHRLRCFGHVLNLSVRAFWFGEMGSKIGQQETYYEMIVVDEENEESVESSKRRTDEFAKWRKMGPWGKIHNVCVYIRGSTQRKELFRQIGAQKMVTAENATRWNTGYDMVKTALELRNEIERFCIRHPDLDDDALTNEEWQQLVAVQDILRPFWEATLRMESRTATIPSVIPLLEFLTSRYKQVISKYAVEKDLHIVQAANLGLAKLEKYYAMMREIPAYVAAVVLDPSSKMDFFESSSWTAKRIQKAKSLVVHLWETEYKGHPDPINSVARAIRTEKELYLEWRTKKRRTSSGDQLEQYLSTPIEDGPIDFVGWWYDKRKAWPQLSKMALDILSIPSMSADPERLFSSGKNVLRDNRARLSSASLVALECIKSWEREGVIESPIAQEIEEALDELGSDSRY
jgi:hAT family C-terminal dimerisation region